MITETLEQRLSRWMQSVFVTVFPDTDSARFEAIVVPAGDEKFGDYQCNSAMALGKALKQAPRAVAQTVVEKAVLPDCVERMEIAGPGFINIHLKSAWLAKHLTDLQSDGRLGVPECGSGKTVVMDYSSPNVAKPMHIGHIRSTVIGNALDRLHRFLGYRVLADNHLGDWGTQFGIMIMGYRHFVDEKALAEAPVEELERVYVKSYEQSRADEQWLNQARQELVKLQAGDPENRALWKRFVDLSIEEFNRIYRRLGVSFDFYRGESHYNDRLPSVIELLKEKGLARESEGALVAFLDEEKLPPCIVQKSDKAFNYATTDLATVMSRVGEFHPDAIVYVTDERQQLHFKQVFTLCRKMGIQANLVHVWFGLMRLPEGTFSTREGNVIKLEKLLDEAENRALEIVRTASPDLPADQQQAIARAVGIGAIKYADLSQNPQSLVTFTWDKALALDGNSAPYLQYACARISSVQDKYQERFPGRNPNDFPLALGDPWERKLAVKLVQFPDAVVDATAAYKPSLLADYLYELAQVYSGFYQNVPFLKADEGIRESRVRLCDVTARTLRQGLSLLGIETPARI